VRVRRVLAGIVAGSLVLVPCAASRADPPASPPATSPPAPQSGGVGPSAPPAATPDRGLGVVTGATILVLGFALGGTVIAAADRENGASNAGWMIMESCLVLAPLAAHGAVGQWGRGLAFAAPPAAFAGGTAALFAYDPGTLIHGSLPEQRILWGLFGAGLIAGVAGVLDVAWAPPQVGSIAVAPTVARDRVGLAIGGTL
jgi:hypothetical protein